MTQAQELRIGNWVLMNVPDRRTGNATPSFNTKVEVGDMMDIAKGYKIVSGIPLTPEILEKAGFEFDGACYGKDGLNFWADNLSGYYHTNNVFTVHVDYVHQLQNLTHALTGNEINIQL